MSRILVPLSNDEVKRVLVEGSRRVMNGLEMNLGAGRFFKCYGGVETHVLGAAAECAFAKFWGVPWEPIKEDFSTRHDVAGHEIRLTQRKWGTFKGCMPHEDKSKKYAAVGISEQLWVFRMVGWLMGQQVRDLGKLEDPNAWGDAYFVHEEKWSIFSEEKIGPWCEKSAQEKIDRAIVDLNRRKA